MQATLERTAGARVGLVVFGGSAHLRFPLSTDPDAAAAVIGSIESGFAAVEGGSSLADAIELARLSFDDESEAGRLVVLISDGENRGADPVLSAERLARSGASLLVVGVGTAGGATIPLPATDEGPGVLEDDAGPIVTRLDEALLRDIARAGQGRYLGAQLAALPGAVVSRLAALDAAQIARLPADVPLQRFGIFAAMALGAAGLAAFADLLAMAFARRAARRTMVALATVLVLTLGAACAERSYELNEEGLEAFGAGDLDAAIAAFGEASSENPADMEIVLNLALSLHEDGRYRDAALAAERATRSTDRGIRLRALVALGHHWYADGQAERALDAYRRALLLDPQHRVARHDYEVILRTTQDSTGDSNSPGGLPPDPNTTPTAPAPSATPGAGATEPVPTDPNATPSPGATQGPGRGTGEDQLESQIAAIDAAIQSILEEDGELSFEETQELLDLVAERNRLADLLESAPGARDPDRR
jgi:tetratricopeptide (TPR) repeat protein